MNLGYVTLNKNDEYVNLEEALGVTLTEGTTYQMQIQGSAMICESESAPTSGGFYCDFLKTLAYKKGSGTVYIQVQSNVANINIGD